jgi:LEA14-like dessication related protein
MKNIPNFLRSNMIVKRFFLFFVLVHCLGACKQRPEEDIVFKYVQGVVVDATDKDPRLKANAVFFNPNDMKAKLKKIELDVFVEGKKAGHVDQKLSLLIPANSEFTVPLEVKLNLKEMGLMNTLFSILGAKKMDVRYVGSIRINYKGIPINVPVDYKSEIRIKI